MSVTVLLIAALCVFVAAALHGVSGTGFALAAMPALLALFGAHSGLRLGLSLGLVASALVLIKHWRAVDLRRVALLALPAIVTIPLGALGARAMPASVLVIVAGVSVLLLVGVAALVPAPDLVAGRRASRHIASGLLTGAIAGFVHVGSALSAPVFTAYALRTRWEPTSFIATAQVVFILFNIASLTAWGFDPSTLPTLGWLAPALALGLVLGVILRERMSKSAAIATITVVALAGGVAAIVRGVVLMATGVAGE